MNEKTAIPQEAPSDFSFHIGENVWIIAVTALLMNSLLRGMRAPNMWACTQMLLNYDLGPVKRGLQGAVLSALNVPNLYSFDFCFWYGAAFLAVNVALLCGLLWRLCMLRDVNARLMACVFASSFAVVMLAHSIGYWEHIGLLVTLLLLAIKNFYVRAIAAAVLFSAILLVYEGLLPIFFPLILFRFLVDAGSPMKQGKLAVLGLLCICVFTMFYWIGTLQISKESVTALAASIQARAQYPAGDGLIYPLTTTNTGRVHDVLTWLSPPILRFALTTWIVTLPTLAYLIHGTLVNLTHLRSSRAVKGMAVIASLSPLSLHAVGFDFNRWTALAITTSLLVLAVTMMSFPSQPAAFPSVTRRRVLAATAIIALNLGGSIILFDGYIVDNFPYPRFTQNVIDIIAGKAPFPPEMELCSAKRDYCYTIIDENGVPEPVTVEELRNRPPKLTR